MLNTRISSLQGRYVGVCYVQVDHVRLLSKKRIDLAHLRVQGADISISRLQLIRHHMFESREPLRE